MHLVLTFIFIAVIGAVLFCMAALLFRGDGSASSWAYFVCQGTVVLWCASQILQMMAKTRGELTAAFLIGNVGICFVGSTWFYFTVLYAGKKIRGVLKYLPGAISTFFFLSVMTNHWHHLYYRDFSLERVIHGPLFYANVVSTYVFTLSGAVILYLKMGKKHPLARRLVVASVLVPVFLNALYLFGFVAPSFDITPLGFGISVFLVMMAAFKYRFMGLKKELAITNEKLLLEQERNRIAQQVHDTAGHTLTMIQSYMKLAEISAGKENFDEVKGYLSEARTLTGQGIKELRESINMLREEAEYELVTQGVMQLANQMKEIPVEVTVRGEDSARYSHLSKTVYDTVRESMTNTLKYAEATKMDVVMRFQKNSLELMIADDGKGCENVKDNNGLRGIRERVQKAGGTVSFISSPGEGFLTRVKLPV
ncbi:MAG: sensor histidine kinase [Lachnospiraceae bacterium]|nr:sensor histidine kinase [Lachnospiraceae bacterium]